MFRDGVGAGDSFEDIERLLQFSGLQCELAHLDLCLSLEEGSFGIHDNAFVGGDRLAVAAEEAVAVACEEVALRLVGWAYGVGGEALEERCREGELALVVVVGGEGVCSGGSVFPLAEAVE